MEPYTTTPKAQSTIAALWRLEKIILDTLDFNNVVNKIVVSTLTELDYLKLGYRVIVLALIDQKTQALKRIAFSHTSEGIKAISSLSMPFNDINIPLSATGNACIKAINTRQPVITRSVADVFYPTLKPEEITPIQEAVGIKTTMVYPVFAKDKALGVLIFSIIKSEQEVSQEEKELLAGFTDVVALAVQNAQLYSSLQDANERLKSLDRLKDEFVSLSSHELRTPMTAIKSYAWMLHEERPGKLNEKQKDYARIIYASTERLIKLVNDMLNVSRIESGNLTIKPEPLDLGKLAKEVITEVLPSAQNQQINIVITPPSSPLDNVLADADKIKEVFFNLIGNSLKFTPPGGTITISFEQKDDVVITHVTDTGKGIKPEDMPKLFQKFGMIEGNYLTKVAGQGSGLGLYISKSIVELLGGTMSVVSEGENRGTTFTFSLKTVPSSVTQEQKQREDPSASSNTPQPFQAHPQA